MRPAPETSRADVAERSEARPVSIPVSSNTGRLRFPSGSASHRAAGVPCILSGQGCRVILTRRLVFIHLAEDRRHLRHRSAQAGGEAAAGGNVLERLGRELGEPALADVLKHGTIREIPARWRDRPRSCSVIPPTPTTASCPSTHFDWWKTKPPPWVDFRELKAPPPRVARGPLRGVRRGFQLFRKLKAPALPPEKQPGTMSEHFVALLFRDPEEAFPASMTPGSASRGWERTWHP
jgi:hypothetical protein